MQSYELQFKEYPATSWNTKKLGALSSDAMFKTEVTNLNPGCTYCLKLVADGQQDGPELIVDTETIGCTPNEKSCCIIQ